MKKNNKILLIVFFSLLVIISVIILNLNDIKKVNKNIIKEELVERMNNKDNFIIYFTTSDKECYLCTDANNYLEYYRNLYNLDIKKINLDKITSKEYKELVEYLDETEMSIIAPTIMIIKNGQKVFVNVEIYFENVLRQALVEYEFIPENIYEKEIDNSGLTFEQVYSSQDKQVILVYNYIELTYDVKKVLLELSNEYKFNYHLLYHGRDNYNEDYLKISNQLESRILPIMLIVQNNQVVDYTTDKTKEQIVSFLEKNEII